LQIVGSAIAYDRPIHGPWFIQFWCIPSSWNPFPFGVSPCIPVH